MSAAKVVLLRRMGEIIKAAPDNYNRTRAAFGDYQFPASEFDQRAKRARDKGYEVHFVETATRGSAPSSVISEPEPEEIEPKGAIDKARGVLKTETAEWVIDCLSNRLMPIHRCRWRGMTPVGPMWIERGRSFYEAYRLYASVFGIPRNERPWARSMPLMEWIKLKRLERGAVAEVEREA